MARFQAKLDPLALLVAAGELLRLADPDEPETVSQSAFDRTPTHDAASAGVPRAAQVAMRLGLPWAEARELALMPAAQRDHTYPLRIRASPSKPSLDAAVAALRLVAKRLGQESLRPHEYDQARTEIEAPNRRAWRHGHPGQLPSLNQLGQVAPWDDLLESAGLAARGSVATRPTASPVAAVVHAFIDACRCWPSQRLLEQWGRAHSVAIPKPREPLPDVREAVIKARLARGLPRPSAPPPGFDPRGPEYAPDPAAALVPASVQPSWARDSLIAGVAAAQRLLEPGDRLTQRRLLALSKDNSDIPRPRSSPLTGSRSARPASWRRAVVGTTERRQLGTRTVRALANHVAAMTAPLRQMSHWERQPRNERQQLGRDVSDDATAGRRF